MTNRRVLVVEDDEDIARLVEMHLTDCNFEVVVAHDGLRAQTLLSEQAFGLVTLDLTLPGLDGISLCQRIRHLDQTIPILMLSARSSELDRVLGLELGADDYMTKPFSIRELQARVKAIFRRADARERPSNDGALTLCVGRLKIDVERREVKIDDRTVQLRAKEFALLHEFARHPGKVYSRAALLEAKSVELGPILEFLGGRPIFPLLGDDPRDPARQKVFSVAPLPAQAKPEAYLYVVLSGEAYDSVADMLLQRRLVRTTLQISAVAAAFLVAAWGLLFWSVTRRLRRLNERLTAFRKSQPASAVAAAAAAGDEIDQLDRTFAQMSQRISQQVDALKQTDQLRRELIANVSHDLRTPLTALHGYIETLLIKGPQLSSAQQREYLETAARSSQRLNKLVSELFELAKLESRREPPRLEAFSASDLLLDVVGEFQIVAEQHRVRLETRIDEDLPSVLGDIELIERALQNLVQNAIQHTPADGEVVIEARREATGVRVSVSDTGQGIPGEDLPYIFDRFHKGGGAIDGSQGAGIGLAIVKRIVELHDSSIHVRSEVNVGTEFAFTLHANGST